MSKYCIILSLLFSSSIFAKDNEMAAVLEFKTKINHKMSYKLIKSNKGISMNGLKLTPEDYAFSLKEISYIFKSKNDESLLKNCHAGTYTLAKHIKGKTTSEKGCINSKRFENLITSFKKVKN
ncbi:MAG: hypothetical protein KC493_09235 [Bacteriovoracaceae bacterium]|nr:hypothetical protein [Bacteriovoracaceae bacterium]